MRIPLDSPFTPGSDTIPAIWAGRDQELSDWRAFLRPRRLAGIAERGRTILGEPGTGKSSLVRRIAEEAELAGDWTTPQLRIPKGSDPLKRLADALLSLAERAGLGAGRDQRIGRIIARVESFALAGFSLSLRPSEGPEPYRALTDLLIEIGRAAMERGDTMILIHIDEVQNITDEDARSQLLIALGDALFHEESVQAPGDYTLKMALPLAVYLTGLPEFSDMAGTRSGATFARRFQTTFLDTLSDEDLLLALQPFVTQGWSTTSPGGTTRVTMEPAAQQKIIDLSCGDPFLFQLAGEAAWYAGAGDTITAQEAEAGWARVAPQAELHVQRILDRLPPSERRFLDSMAALAPKDRTLTAIAASMGLDKASTAGPISQRLDVNRRIIQRGKPYSFRYRPVEALLTGDWPYA